MLESFMKNYLIFALKFIKYYLVSKKKTIDVCIRSVLVASCKKAFKVSLQTKYLCNKFLYLFGCKKKG